MRSPSQPKATPPSAAPSKNVAVMIPIQLPTCPSPPGPSMESRAGRATTGNKPISNPSNNQPSTAARSASLAPRLIPGGGGVSGAEGGMGRMECLKRISGPDGLIILPALPGNPPQRTDKCSSTRLSGKLPGQAPAGSRVPSVTPSFDCAFRLRQRSAPSARPSSRAR